MKIALVGYGKMGKMVENLIIEKGFSISFILDKDNLTDLNSLNKSNTDVVIEFTEPSSALNNVKLILSKGINVVSGTTGWHVPVNEIEELCSISGAAFIQSSNFNIGTHIFFMLNRIMAEKSSALNYKLSIEETHHIHKKDKPSGTAVTLANEIISKSKHYNKWELSEKNVSEKNNTIPVVSYREGEVTGIHKSQWLSDTDIIEISHNALNRNGFATGALMAAGFLSGKTGVFTMNDLLTEII